MTDPPAPQEQGQLVPPRRRPPTAVAVETPDPPQDSRLHHFLKWLSQVIRPVTGG